MTMSSVSSSGPNISVPQAISGRVAQADNVRAALALVAAGETPLGIVYETDAAASLLGPGIEAIWIISGTL